MAKNYGPLRVAYIEEVYDGDTFFMDFEQIHPLFGKHIGISILNLDTPETRTRNKEEKAFGLVAKAWAKKLLYEATLVTLENCSRDKYGGRVDADVIIDGQNFADIMKEKKLGYAYRGKKRKDWKKNILERKKRFYKFFDQSVKFDIRYHYDVAAVIKFVKEGVADEYDKLHKITNTYFLKLWNLEKKKEIQ